MNIKKLIKQYDPKNITIGVLGSHSALDICRGAKDEGFKTLVIAQKGRDKTYSSYYKSENGIGCVDEVITLNKFADILKPEVQQELIKRNCIFIPHRSFEVYINDYNAIENKFEVPMFGNKFLLKTEERTEKLNQYSLLDKANIKYPKRFKNPNDIDRLVIVKAQEQQRGFERAFFLVHNKNEFYHEWDKRKKTGKITNVPLENLIIEEFVLGAQVNFNFFYSLINNRLELIGTDTRRQTNLDGILRLTQNYQEQIFEDSLVEPKYEEAGHVAVTVLESLLEQAFEMGEKFVKVCQEMIKPGVIGPFGLQSVITAGPPKKEIIVFDVSPRMPGSPGISATPYSAYLFGTPVSAGRRIAMEIKNAVKLQRLNEILT